MAKRTVSKRDDDFWNGLVRDHIGFGDVDPEDSILLELVDALEGEGVPRDRARRAILVAVDEGRRSLARQVGGAVQSGVSSLIQRIVGGRK